jgi:aspartyl/asparaginyl-tRNA synthetase
MSIFIQVRDFLSFSSATGMQNIRDVIPFPRTPGNAEF